MPGLAHPSHCPFWLSLPAQAYCLYRLGRLQEALAALQQVPPGGDQAVARLQLEAQLHYRLGAPKEAIQQYSQVRRTLVLSLARLA